MQEGYYILVNHNYSESWSTAKKNKTNISCSNLTNKNQLVAATSLTKYLTCE